MKANLKTLDNFIGLATDYLSKNPDERSLVTFALQEVGRPVMEITQAQADLYLKKRKELEAKYCSKDGKGNFIEEKFESQAGRVAFRKKFTEENARLLDQDLSDFKADQDKILFEIEPYIVDTPEVFDMQYRRVFEGFIFPVMTKEEELAWYLGKKA